MQRYQQKGKYMKKLQITFLILILTLGQLAGIRAATRLTSGDAVVNDNLGTTVAISGDYAVVGVPQDDGEGGADSGSVHIYKRSTTSWELEARLSPSDIDADDEFGHAVAISGDYVIVGVPKNADLGENTGSAYIFVRAPTGWIEQEKLFPDDLEQGDQFGFSVSIDGNTAVIGAYRSNDPLSDSGVVYVFVRNGDSWTQQAKIHTDDAKAFEWFGYSVAVSGDTLIAGAIRSNAEGEDSGAAYIFARNEGNWTQQAKLTGNNTKLRDEFGFSVAISGDFAIVGSPNNAERGAAYIFEREENVWSQKRNAVRKRMIGIDTQKGDQFGYSVSISGETALVGARTHEINEQPFGAAYTFQRQKPFWVPHAKLLASDKAESDLFGESVAISGDTLIVGAPSHSAGGPNSGAAYIFGRDEGSWLPQAKLFDTKTASEDQFGSAVSIDRDTAIIGAQQDDDAGRNSGAAYIFIRRKDDWIQQAKIVPTDGATGDVFGYAVGISGETSIIGAYGDDDASPEGGSAYIFVRNGTEWTQQAKFVVNETASLDHFGAAVAIDGDTAIVGAHGRDEVGIDSGAAYIFVRSGTAWTQQAKLIPDDGVEDDFFGFSVSISGDTAVVGAHGNDAVGIDSGAAYIFVRSGTTWTQQAKLTAGDAAIGDEFGYAVDINNADVIVGAWKDDHAGVDSGSAYVFVSTRLGWIQQAKLIASDAESNDEFGIAVSISRETAIVGAWLDDHPPGDPPDVPENHIDKGSVYTYLRNRLAWSEQKRVIAIGTRIFDQFGRSLAISGLYSVVGVHHADNAGSDAGAADMFDLIDLGLIPPGQPLGVDPSSLQLTTLGGLKTSLRQNYPNPFNPETWLPYTLAETADVTIRIYDVNGRLVRQLELGVLKAGNYLNKNQAAYWDGKDQFGGVVSSGIYFYTFTAGGFETTRRMVILK
jgi:hypothetical protein